MDASFSEQIIVDMAQELWNDQDQVTLDEVDGMFYWAVCRNDIVSAWVSFSKKGSEELRGRGRLEAFWDMVREIEAVAPDVPDWMDPGRSGMRGPVSIVRKSGTGIQVPNLRHGTRTLLHPRWISVGVRSSSWTGVDLEHHVHGLVRQHREWFGEAPAEEHVAFANFRFYAASETVYRASVALRGLHLTIHGPMILCTFMYPPPPWGQVAELYDSMAIKQQWHTRLRGYAVDHNQTVPVAIRTWMLGLLIGTAGMNFMQAAHEVELRLGTSVTESRFEVDRTRLVERVPEARPFVSGRTSPDTTN